MEPNTLYCGDCLEWLSRWDDNSVDLIGNINVSHFVRYLRFSLNNKDSRTVKVTSSSS